MTSKKKKPAKAKRKRSAKPKAKVKSKGKRGRKEWKPSPEILTVIEEITGSEGLSQDQVARAIGISPSSWYEKVQKFPEMLEHYKRGVSTAIRKVENALFQNATVGTDKSPNGIPSAQFFYLANRRPEVWNRQRKSDKNPDKDPDIPKDTRELSDRDLEHIAGGGRQRATG